MLVDVLAKSVISYQLSVISIKWQVGSFLFTDYWLLVTEKNTHLLFPLKIMYSTDVVTDAVLRTKNLNVYYGSNLAVRDVNLDIPEKKAIAFIGPSGCGKSTVLRCFNRMNDLVKSAKIEGKVTFREIGRAHV